MWRKILKFTVTLSLLYLIYYSAAAVAEYLSAPRLDMTMSPLAGPQAVTVATVERGSLESTVTYTGSVIPRLVVKVFPRVEGWLEDILVDVGDEVAQGQLLVQLDREELETLLEEAKAHREFSEKEYRRDSFLVKEGAISQSEADRSLMIYEEALAKEEKIKTLLSYTEIRSPIDGVVTDRLKLINPGELVFPRTRLMDLADTQEMRVQVNVAETDLPLIQVGTPALVRFPHVEKPYDKIRAQVTAIFPRLDPKTRTGRIEILIPNPKGIFQEDMYAIVEFTLKRKKNILKVPREAVLKVDGDWAVFTTDTVVAEKRVVTPGISTNEWIEIREGLQEGEMIITKGARGLTDFQEVTVVSGF